MNRFIAAADRYEQNTITGRTAKAIPATLTTPTGEHEHGIAITVGDRPRIVIPTRDAIRLAHGIADAAEQQRRD